MENELLIFSRSNCPTRRAISNESSLRWMTILLFLSMFCALLFWGCETHRPCYDVRVPDMELTDITVLDALFEIHQRTKSAVGADTFGASYTVMALSPKTEKLKRNVSIKNMSVHEAYCMVADTYGLRHYYELGRFANPCFV